jgi:hypothetical protein
MTPRSILRAGHLFGIVIVATAAIAYAAPASAKAVTIHGTHSKQSIAAACDKAGGINVQGQGGKGYGCVNTSKGTMVACSNNGVCTGYVPD